MIIRILKFLVLTLLLSACRQKSPQGDLASGKIRVTDFRGKTIALGQPANRIVCLIESALSGLYMLNAENQVVGVSSGVYTESASMQYSILDDRIKNKELPVAGNWDFVNIESLVALKPDLVIIWSSQEESIMAIEEKGIPVYGVFLTSIKDIYKEITDLGILTGKESRADSIITYTINEVRPLADKTSDDNKKSVYFIWPQGLLETSGTRSTVNEVIELAGATNVCRQDYEHLVINKETLIELNPDIMLMWDNSSLNPDNIIHLPELQSINAITNRDVYELPGVFWCDLWTLKYQYAVRLLAKHCYPDRFVDFSPEGELKKMIIALYGQKGQELL